MLLHKSFSAQIPGTQCSRLPGRSKSAGNPPSLTGTSAQDPGPRTPPVQTSARSFESDINVRNERTLIDGKSVLGLFDLDLSRNVYADLISDDENEIFRFKTVMEAFS